MVERATVQKKWKVGAGVAAAVILMAACGSSGDEQSQSAAKRPAAVTSSAPSSSAAATSASPKPKKTSTPKPAPTGIARDVESAVLNGLAVKSFIETCGTIGWSCAITKMEDGAAGNVDVYVQEHLTKDEAKRIAMSVANFAKCSVKDLDWVIVHEAGGGARGQFRAGDSLIKC